MPWKFSYRTITLEGRGLGRNPFRLFITSIYSIEWDIKESKRKVSPQKVPSLVELKLTKNNDDVHLIKKTHPTRCFFTCRNFIIITKIKMHGVTHITAGGWLMNFNIYRTARASTLLDSIIATHQWQPQMHRARNIGPGVTGPWESLVLCIIKLLHR